MSDVPIFIHYFIIVYMFSSYYIFWDIEVFVNHFVCQMFVLIIHTLAYYSN